VINRLRPLGDGDILVPGGTVSLLGTTSETVNDPDSIGPTVAEVDHLLEQGAALIPELERTRFIRAFSGVRPLVMSSADETLGGRKASRGFVLFDHESEGVNNLATITGGKLTTFRLMAEKTGDLVARRLGNHQPCRSAQMELPTDTSVQWSKPASAAKYWFNKTDASDLILCECEMVPQSVVQQILEQAPGSEQEMTLKAIALRSRMGKGTCQGAFCSIRVTSYLYDQAVYRNRDGLKHMRDFIDERFKGIRPVLWGEQMPQVELAETMHCGLMGLDQDDEHFVEKDDPDS
jgi:glycerol-3-phosphate dehydrogenase